MQSQPRSSEQVINEALEDAGHRADIFAARIRVLTMGVLVVIGAIIRIFFGVRLGWASPVWMGSYLVFAIGALIYAQRHPRTGQRFAVITHGMDVLFIALYAPIILAAAPKFITHETAVRNIAYIIPSGMLMALAIASARGSRKLSAGLGVFSAVVSFVVLFASSGFQFAQIYVSMSLVLTGISGRALAGRTRSMVEAMEKLKLLRAFVPEQVQDRVATDPNGAFTIGGEVHTLTLLVADLRGFTQMAERLPPDEVVEQVNAFHAAMLEVARAHEGKLDKFLGDGALMVFGLDRATGRTSGRRDHGAHAAVSCARGMMRALEDLNEDRAARHLEPLAMGIGIHTGRVVAGNIGVPDVRLEWTVIGDAVNTAARIQGACRELGAQALVSAETVALLPDQAGLRAVEPLQLKGKAAKVPVFALGALTK